MRSDDIYNLPDNLVPPMDDGLCDHLNGCQIPAISLPATSGDKVNLSSIDGYVVVFCYPRSGRPDQEPPSGWNYIPGARGCTPQMCNINVNYPAFKNFGATIFGLSTQNSAYQKEMSARLGLRFDVISDARLELATALNLPTFTVAGMTLIKRLTLIIKNGSIVHVIYPVFPPDESAKSVLVYLQANGSVAH